MHKSNDLRHVIISNHLFVDHSAIGTMSFLWYVGVLKLINPLGPSPAAALSLRNPMRREVTVSNDPGIQL